MVIAPSSGPARRRGGQSSSTGGRQQKKWSKWVGVRYRHWGRWAAEIRVPRTRSRLWIGTFDDDLQAALAYDAAMFCFYGERLPRPHKFNFPDAPRPDIPEHVRVRLNVANIKAIAEKYAHTLGSYYIPPPVAAPLEVAAASAAAAAGAGATAATTDYGDVNYDIDEDIVTCADCLLSFNPDEYVGVMDDLINLQY